MFKSLHSNGDKKLNHSGRSMIGETLQVEGDIRSSGAVDVSGLVNGNVYVGEMILFETGSVVGNLEVNKVEINGHLDGKVTADTIIIGKSAVIKGDIFFRNTLKTEEGADIDGYIKRIDNGKTKSQEEIEIEEIVNRPEVSKPRFVARARKEAV